PAFFSTIRHPPSSPLFPYTTLFRSVLDDEPAAVVLLVARGPHPHLRKLDLAVLRHVQAGDTLDLVTPGLLVLRNLVQRDRDLGGLACRVVLDQVLRPGTRPPSGRRLRGGTQFVSQAHRHTPPCGAEAQWNARREYPRRSAP